MKQLLTPLLLFSPLACSDEDRVTCTNCQSDIAGDFVLCKEANGHASVNGEATGVDYNLYLQDLLDEGVVCED